jgi:hypothetical protein
MSARDDYPAERHEYADYTVRQMPDDQYTAMCGEIERLRACVGLMIERHGIAIKPAGDPIKGGDELCDDPTCRVCAALRSDRCQRCWGDDQLHNYRCPRCGGTALEPGVGVEPTTPSLRVTCSTTELTGRPAVNVATAPQIGESVLTTDRFDVFEQYRHDMRAERRHVGLAYEGDDAFCVMCDEAWPCSTELSGRSGPAYPSRPEGNDRHAV